MRVVSWWKRWRVLVVVIAAIFAFMAALWIDDYVSTHKRMLLKSAATITYVLAENRAPRKAPDSLDIYN